MRVYVVDDEPDLRVSLSLVLRQAGFVVRTFATGSAFLAAADELAPGCVLLDLHLPDINGLDVQRRLAEGDSAHVVVLLTGAGGVTEAVTAMRTGAVDFLQKPYRKPQLMDALRRARARLGQRGEDLRRQAVLATLSRREREVLASLAEGKLSKNIAFELGLSPRTIEMYRTKILRKLDAPTMGAALLLAQAAGLIATPPG